MILGGFVPSAGHAGKYFLKALKVKSKLTSELERIFKKFDFLISPTVPIQPFKFGEKIKDPVSFMLVDFNTVQLILLENLQYQFHTKLQMDYL